MSVFEELLTASFRGVTFLVPRENKESGKKTVSHEYPGSDRRFVEELGRRPGIHNITGIIHGSGAIQSRINLEEALTRPARGLLIHPSLGQIMVVATDFSSRSSDTNIGEFIFNITFMESEENLTLSPIISSNQNISFLRDEASGFLDSAFISRFENTGVTFVLQNLDTQSSNVLDELSSIAQSIIDPDEDQASSLNTIIDSVSNRLAASVRSGSTLAGDFRSIYDVFDTVSGSISDYVDLYDPLTEFGNDRVAKALITAKRILEETNLSAVEDHVRLNALTGMYEGAVYREYNTDVELTAVQSLLEGKYDELIQSASEDSLAFDPNVRRTINEIRVRSRDIFEEKLQNVWRVVGISPNEESMPLTSYRYYGSLDQLNELRNLNPDVNAAVFNQDLRGLT